MNAQQLQAQFQQDPAASVLFFSRPIKGDKFIIGKQAELVSSSAVLPGHTTQIDEDVSLEHTTVGDLLNRLDFEAYEDQEIEVEIWS